MEPCIQPQSVRKAPRKLIALTVGKRPNEESESLGAVTVPMGQLGWALLVLDRVCARTVEGLHAPKLLGSTFISP